MPNALAAQLQFSQLHPQCHALQCHTHTLQHPRAQQNVIPGPNSQSARSSDRHASTLHHVLLLSDMLPGILTLSLQTHYWVWCL